MGGGGGLAALTLLLAGATAMDTCPGLDLPEYLEYLREFYKPVCSDGTCLAVWEACHGVSLCAGARAWCQDPRRQDRQYVGDYTNCQGRWSGQFVLPSQFSDSTTYHCLDRSDEPVFSERQEEVELPVLETCTAPGVSHGLRCHPSRGEYTGGGGGYYSERMKRWNTSGCVDRDYWCFGSIFPCAALGGRSISDGALCANRTYWADVPCPEHFPYKCSGTVPGGCGRLGGSRCIDGSDNMPKVESVKKCRTLRRNSSVPLTLQDSVVACEVNGTLRCLDPVSRCDTTPQCDDSSDEKEVNGTNCKSEYERKGLIPKGADYECESPDFPDVTIWTVACDGRAECAGRKDEVRTNGTGLLCSLDVETTYLIIGITPIVLTIVAITTSTCILAITRSKSARYSRGETTQVVRTLTEQNGLDDSVFNDDHISSALSVVQAIQSRDDRRGTNKRFVRRLKKKYGAKPGMIWLKHHATNHTSKGLLDDYRHSGKWLQTKADQFEDVAASCGVLFGCPPGAEPSKVSVGSLLKRLKMIGSLYFDLIKETVLFGTLGFLVSVAVSSLGLFPFAITTLLFCSIFPPLLASALTTAWRRPTIVLGHRAWRTFLDSPPTFWGVSSLSILRILSFMAYWLVPAVLINNREVAKMRRTKVMFKIKRQFEENEDGAVDSDLLSEIQDLDLYLAEARLSVNSFKRGELAVEVPVQLGLLLTMLLLALSSTVTHSGLQTFFKLRPDDSWSEKLLFYGSLMWSFKTCFFTYLKVKSEKKAQMLSLIAKMFLGTRGLLVLSTKIVCGVSFFVPSLGLLSVLQHLKAERLPLNVDLFDRMKDSNDSFFDQATIEKLYRTDIDYTYYTLVSLQEAFGLFIALLVIHAIANFIVKSTLSNQFKGADWSSKTQHCIEMLSIPEVYSDFDDDDGLEELSPKDFEKAWRDCFSEILTSIFLNLVSNMLMLVPIFVTAGRISERHFLLEATIGSFPEEKEAFATITFLRWLLPSLVLVGSVVDALMMTAYSMWLHPWLPIITEELASSEGEDDGEEEESMEEGQQEEELQAERLPLQGLPRSSAARQ